MPADMLSAVPESDYHAPQLGRASVSAMRELLRSPAHYRAWLASPREQTEAMALGSAAHCRILEPARFRSAYATPPKCDRRTKEGKAEWAAWLAAHPGCEPLTLDAALACERMAAAVDAHPAASALLRRATEREVTVRWREPWGEDTVPAQARFDAWDSAGQIIVDLKTARDASADGFARAAAQRSYHLQAAWYLRAAQRAGYDSPTFALICVESSEPHGVAVYTFSADAIGRGAMLADRAVSILSECLRTDRWPCYPTTPQELALPSWAA